MHETGGEAALAEISRKKPNFKNRADPKVEQAVVDFALGPPAYGHDLQEGGHVRSSRG